MPYTTPPAKKRLFQRINERLAAIRHSINKHTDKHYNAYTQFVLLCVIFICFLVLRAFINSQLQALWVEKILSLFQPNDFFDVFLVLLAGVIIYSNRKRSLKTAGYLAIAFFCWYRFFDSYWLFHSLFAKEKFGRYCPLYIDLFGLYFLLPVFYHCYKRFQKSPPKERFEDGFLYTDLPIKKEADRSSQTLLDLDKAGLNRNKFATQIAEVITLMRPFEAFAIGICGPWGSGKTSLISLITENIRSLDKQERFMFIEFSPWFFENSESLITSFFSELEKKFRSNKTLAATLKAYGKEIAMAEKTLFSSEISVLFLAEEKSLSERYSLIKEEIKKEGKLIVISIDDLDRLDTKEIVQIFRLIRLVADFPLTFYIVGYDKGYILSAIKKELTGHNPAKYTDKIFNIEFKIPETSLEIIADRLKLAINNQLSMLGSKAGRVNEKELKDACQYKELNRFLKNERDIKRFCNNLMIRYLSLKEEVNFYHMFLLELIYFDNGKIFTALYENRVQVFAAYTAMISRKTDSDPLQFNKLLGIAIPHPIENILYLLFGKNSHRQRYSIGNEQYFNRYFSLSLLATDFTNAEFEAAFEGPHEKLRQQLVIFNTSNSSLLREKLNDRFLESSIPETPSFEETIDVLLHLYNEVYYSKDVNALQDGLNANNLGMLIINLLLGKNLDPGFLEQRLLVFELQDYAPFSYLVSMHSLGMFTSRLTDQAFRQWRLAFRDIQVMLLSRSIQNSASELHEGIIGQFLNVAEFISRTNDGAPDAADLKWHTDNIIDPYQGVLLSNTTQLTQYIKLDATVSGHYHRDVGAAKMQQIFPGFDKLIVKPGFERLRMFYEGYDIIKTIPFSFFNQSPVNQNNPALNDHFYPEKFQLKKGHCFDIVLNPGQTPLWRFGFRFSGSPEFPPLDESRHQENSPYLHLSKGNIYVSEPDRTDEMLNVLRLSLYTGSSEDQSVPLIKNYDNEPLKFRFGRKQTGSLFLSFDDDRLRPESKNFGYDNLDNTQFMQIAAWADCRPFNLSAHIVVLQEIP